MTPPGEAEYFEGGGLMRTIQESMKRQKMCSSPISQPLMPVTPAGLILTITVAILPPARVLAEDLMKVSLKEGSPNLLKVAVKCIGRKVTSESTSSPGTGHQSGSKDNTESSSRPGASVTCPSTPDSNGGTAGSSGQGPNELKQVVAHLAMVVSDDEFADDPDQIIPTEDIFTIPAIPREDLEGFDEGYFLPAEVTAFRGSTTMNQVMSGLATLACPLLTTLWIIKDMWLQNSTWVQQPILHTLGSFQQG